MTTSFSLRTLSRDDILHHLPALSEILASCVNGGASVSFMRAFRAANGDNVLATHCPTAWRPGAHCAGRLRRGGTSRWHRATYHQSTRKPAPSSGCRQIIGSPKCPPPRDRPGIDERAGAHCPAGKEDGAGAGHGDRQRGRNSSMPAAAGKKWGNSALCANARRRK